MDVRTLWRCEACNREWEGVAEDPCPGCGQPGRALPSKPCPTCAAPLRIAARSCRVCGTALGTSFCTSCHYPVESQVTTCPSCGADPRAKVEVDEADEGAGVARARRPLFVGALGLVYVLLAARYVLLSGVLRADPALAGDWFYGLLSGGLLLIPAAILLIVGVGFLFLRAPWVLAVAVLLGVLALIVAGVEGTVGIVKGIEAMGKDAYYGRPPGAGGLVFAVVEALLGVLACALHLMVLTADAVTGWFR